VRGSGPALTYWQLAAEQDLAREASGQVLPKPVDKYRLVGKSLRRIDIEAKITGPAFIQDLQLQGMLHGRIVRPPSYRARLLSLDDSVVKKMVGVRAIVREGSFVGVIAEREEQAIRAMAALAELCVWNERADLPSFDAIPDFLMAQPTDDEIVSNKGTSTGRLGPTLSATYTRPYLAHASIGPSCGLAWWHDGILEIWSHSQSIYALRDAIANH
jgi:CO/xanthine dehydrogenase Mo-binding subunit